MLEPKNDYRIFPNTIRALYFSWANFSASYKRKRLVYERDLYCSYLVPISIVTGKIFETPNMKYKNDLLKYENANKEA